MDDISGIVTPLCIILPQMSGRIKNFENAGKSMSFKIEDDSVYLKYNEIWNKIKELLGGIKFHSYISYIKTKVKTFSEMIEIEYICITGISVDSVLKIDQKNYPQVYLEQCKYKVKKREMKSFVDYEIGLDSDYKSD